MPLKVQFYAEDVFRVWGAWSERVNGKVRPGIKIHLEDQVASATTREGSSIGKNANPDYEGITVLGIEALEVDYKNMKSHLEKSIPLVEAGESMPCAICQVPLKLDETPALVCPGSDCASVTHISCLSQKFLNDEGNTNAVVPVSGDCPSCNNRFEWAPLVKELSLRMRGQKEISKLFKKPRQRKASKGASMAPPSAQPIAPQSTATGADDDGGDDDFGDGSNDSIDESEEEVPPSPVMQAITKGADLSDVTEDDGFYNIDDFSDVDNVSEGGMDASASMPTSYQTPKERLEIVIQDSESDPEELF